MYVSPDHQEMGLPPPPPPSPMLMYFLYDLSYKNLVKKSRKLYEVYKRNSIDQKLKNVIYSLLYEYNTVLLKSKIVIILTKP